MHYNWFISLLILPKIHPSFLWEMSPLFCRVSDKPDFAEFYLLALFTTILLPAFPVNWELGLESPVYPIMFQQCSMFGVSAKVP